MRRARCPSLGSQPQSPCLSSPAFGPHVGALGSAALCAIQGGDCSLSLRSLSIPPLPPSPPPSSFSSLLSFPLSPSSTLSPARSLSFSQSQCRQLEQNLIPLQFKGEQTRLCAQATLAGRKPPAGFPQRQLTKMPNSVRISEESQRHWGGEGRGRWSQRQLPSIFKKKKKKSLFAKGRKSASRFVASEVPWHDG